jgi:hypothetical protein
MMQVDSESSSSSDVTDRYSDENPEDLIVNHKPRQEEAPQSSLI